MSPVEALTDEIMDALRPVLHGKPNKDVIEALATAFWSATIAAGMTPMDSLNLVRSYADQLDPQRLSGVSRGPDNDC